MARRDRRDKALALLRRAFGDEVEEIVATAFTPDAPVDVSVAPARAPEPDRDEAPREAPVRDGAPPPSGSPPQGELF